LFRYLVRRFLFLIFVLWVVSILTFLIFVKLPSSDPAIRAAGRTQTPETIAAARAALGLNKPVWVQYWRFAKGLIPLPGFFLNRQVYYSWSNFTPVSKEIYGRLPVTLVLAIGAGVVWLVIGIPIGIVSAVKRRTFIDRAGMLFALFGVSAPVFWLAYVLLFVFWFKLHWAPGSGIPLGMSVWSAVLHGRFILPWITLALTYSAFYARIIRSSLIETMQEDFVRTARAKGLSEPRVILKHGLRVAINPVVTLFGIDLGYLLGGAIIVENVFNLQGVGQLGIQSLFTNDFPAVMGVTILASFFIIMANLVIDVVYAFLDPRIRYQ
jgi:peptide/nickel transport system permease protein